MPIPLPKLDDRSFDQLVRDAQERAHDCRSRRVRRSPHERGSGDRRDWLTRSYEARRS